MSVYTNYVRKAGKYLIDAITIAALSFATGVVAFIVGALLNLRLWLLGSESILSTIVSVIKTVFSGRLLTIIRVFIINIFGQGRLYSVDRLRGLEKASFVTFYVLLILINHVLADFVAGVSSLEAFLYEFFRSPFFPAYIFEEVANLQTPLWSAYFFIDNLSMAMVLFFAELLAVHRRFFKKHFEAATREDAVLLFLPVIWFIFRYVAEAVTIVKYGSPPGSQFMFVAYAISLLLTPQNEAQLLLLYSSLWPIAGFFLGLFFGVIPYTGRLWHAFAAPLTMLVNSVGGERR
jgi:hypothetical protein